MIATEIEARVRAICSALPEAAEKTSHGAPACFVGKQFLMLWANGHHGDVDWDEVGAIGEDGFRTVVPKRAVGALDARKLARAGRGASGSPHPRRV